MKAATLTNSWLAGTVGMLAVGAVLLSTEAGAMPVVANSSFEDVQIGSPFRSTNVANVPGWTRSGAAGDAALWHIGYADGGGSITVAGDGNQFVTLGGGASASGETHWSQTIGGFMPGQDYVMSFMMATEHGTVIPQFAIPQTITASFLSGSDTAAQSFTENAPAGANYWRVWVTKSLVFHATASSVTVDFGSITQYDVGLDNVSITEASPVPEPSTMLLLGSGLAGLALWRRKRQG